MLPPPDDDPCGDDHLSVIEDLDPEPARDSGAARRWNVFELVAGLLLVAAVVGWSGYTWWRDETNRSIYAQAQKAATQRHWEEALARYSEVKGYKDATARAAEAEGKLRERDTQYKLASDLSDSGSPARALKAARAVEDIQPDYKDVAELVRRAEGRVQDDALGGAIVMRQGANPPGLYYRARGDWVWLQDSD